MSKICILDKFKKKCIISALKKHNVINLVLDINYSSGSVNYIVFFKYRGFVFSKSLGYSSGLYEQPYYNIDEYIESVSQELDFFCSYIDSKILVHKKVNNDTRFLAKSSLLHTFSFLIKDFNKCRLFERIEEKIDREKLFKKYEMLLNDCVSPYFITEMFFEDFKLSNQKSVDFITNYNNQKYES